MDACCTGALRFGEEGDFAEELSCAEVLSPEWGTAPRVYYLHKPKRFIAATVVDKEADEVVEGATVTLQRAEDDATVATAQPTSSATCGWKASSPAGTGCGCRRRATLTCRARST